MAAHFLNRVSCLLSAQGGHICKLPFALRPGLSQENRIHTHQGKEVAKGMTKEEQRKEQRKPRPVPCTSSADAMKKGVGRNSGFSSPLRHPTPPPPPSSPLPVPGAPETPILTRLSPRLPQLGPAFPLAEVIPSLRPAPAPPALGGGSALRPLKVLPD